MKTILIGIFIFFFLSATNVLASDLYVDGNIASNCSGNYSISGRSCTGSNGNAYKTIANGISNLQAGDTLYIRQGTYTTTGLSLDISGSTTTITNYNNEAVTISKSSIRLPIFSLSDSSSNITFRGLTLESQLYGLIQGSWSNLGSNVWSRSLTPEPTQIRFNTTVGSNVGSQGEVNSANKWYWSGGTLYVYSTSNPDSTYSSPGLNQTDNYDAIGIGNPSGIAGNLITIDNCVFQNFSHSAIKGNYRYHILNSKFSSIGTDDNDHDIYLTGEQTDGSESIIEYNEFNYTPGALIHLYSHPSHIIIRYNILNGYNGVSHSTWGILLSGSYIDIYNNSFYGNSTGITFYTSNAHHNNLINNIFYGNISSDYYIDTYGGGFYPVNNTSQYNYFGSTTKCNGCTDQTGSGGDNYALYLIGTNLQGTTNPYLNADLNDWSDFVLNPTSSLINAGTNLGTSNQLGLSSASTSWPANTINQNSHGIGWEIGAFVDYVAPASSTNSQNSLDSTSSNYSYYCPDQPINGQTNLFEIRTTANTATVYFTGVQNASKYLIFYGPLKKPNQYATSMYSNSRAVISHKINQLRPNTTYQFRVVPATDCQAGKSSNSKTAKTISSGYTPKLVKTIVVTPTPILIPTETITVQVSVPIPVVQEPNKENKLIQWIKRLFAP